MSNVIGQNLNKFLKSVGGEAEGSFKIYEANSRTHVFLKMENLPGAPACDFSIDLPGDTDKLVAQGLNYGLDAVRDEGNETPPPA